MTRMLQVANRSMLSCSRCMCRHFNPLLAIPSRRSLASQLNAVEQDSPSSQAQQQQQQQPRAAAPQRPPAGRPAPSRAPPVPLGPDGQPLQMVSVEKEGKDVFAGIAALDDGKETNWSKVAVLAAGDFVALAVFAAIGRAGHGEPLNLETFWTAMPFIVGWFVTAPFLGGFGAEAQGSRVGPAALTAAKCWAVGMPVGLLLRSITRGYLPATPFIIVSMASTAALLVGWRSALAANTKEAVPLTRAQQLAARKDKQGNPFEALQMIMSMTKRW